MTAAPSSLASGRYRVERVLGRGGMGVVYLAHDTALDRRVAVKLLGEHVLGDEGLRARFVREARLAARLSHPNVVAVYDSGTDGDTPYLVMECIEGDALDGRGPLPAAEVESIVRQVLAGLGHAHDAGVVHRDVKPHNLLVRTDGTVKISDFGIARAAHESSVLTQAGSLLGTLGYLAPEVALGEQATPRSDLYGVGAVAYELLTGRLPREIPTIAALASPGPVEPLGDGALERAVLGCLEADPSRRPASAAEVLRLLDGEDGPATAAEPTVPLVVHHRARPRWGLAAAALAALALAGALGVATLGGDDAPAPRPAAADRVPSGGTPAADARALAAWLRAHAG